MRGYTKLFSTIIGSTIWREPDHVRLVWITMLATANQYGDVECSVPGLADFARVSREQCEDALRVLSAPDVDSRTKTDEGRRIETIDGGWRVINHGKYRQKMNADDRREYKRLKMREYRARLGNASVTTGNALVTLPVDTCRQLLPALTQAEAEAEAEADTKAKTDTKTTPKERAAGLIISPLAFARLQETHAYVGAKLRVPNALHSELMAKSGANADQELRAWYSTLDA
ncbi:MAG: hypothetical protein M3R13_12225, partial [Armatimonadota bacterium]|nr:hypothetical protein [Armatimonadota bacterium]